MQLVLYVRNTPGAAEDGDLQAIPKLAAERGAARRAGPPWHGTAYSYLHFPLIAGIVLLALGLKETLATTGETLDAVPALALCGGPALYLLGQISFRERVLGSFSPHRALTAAAQLALIPLALVADALAALGAVAAVLAILIAYEAVHFREERARVRANPSATLAEMRG